MTFQGQAGFAYPRPPTWPRRRHFFWLAVFFTAVAVYGSVVPLDYAPVPWADAVAQFEHVFRSPVQIASRSDWMANVLLFVPISGCWLAALTLDRRLIRTILTAPAILVASAVLGVVLEFSQTFFPSRTPSQNDIAAQILGAVIGVILWGTMGQPLTDWTRQSTARRHPRERLDWLLEVYLIGLLLCSLLPLDLTIRPKELLQKHRAGQIELIPFAHTRLDFEGASQLIRDTVAFIPVGMLVSIWHRPRHWPTRPLGTSLLLGGLAVLAIETAQLFVRSRHSDLGQVLLGTLGVGLGAWAMGRWRGSPDEEMLQTGPGGSFRQFCLWAALLTLYGLLVTAFFCAPFDIIHDHQQIRDRYDAFFEVPFTVLYQGSWMKSVSEVLKKLILFSPMGVFSVLAAGALAPPRPVRRILLAFLLALSAAVGTTIEMLQVFIASHSPSISDVLLYTIGAAIGMLVTSWVLGAQSDNAVADGANGNRASRSSPRVEGGADDRPQAV